MSVLKKTLIKIADKQENFIKGTVQKDFKILLIKIGIRLSPIIR